MRAAQSQAQGAKSALAEFRFYWYRLSDVFARARRLKRGRGKEFVQVDAEDAEERYRREPVEFLTAEKMFDARWAMTVLGEALNKLRQADAAAGKASPFETLRVFLEPNNSVAPPSYEEVASRLERSIAGVKTPIHRCEIDTPHGSEGRSAARCPIRQRSTRRFMLFAMLWLHPKGG